ncbi:MAG TPA: hypothetical protein VHO84_03505, partial [Syntrophorhabdaceae bacterium]|nr:hypothetical protein [Syntrophorhabdaceae bacterium]
GSLHLSGRTDGTFLLGGKVVKPSDDGEFLVEDESDLVKNLLTGRFAETNVKTILMQRWLPGNPIIVRSPPADSKK